MIKVLLEDWPGEPSSFEFDDSHEAVFQDGWLVINKVARFASKGPGDFTWYYPSSWFPPQQTDSSYSFNWMVAAYPAHRVLRVTQEIKTEKVAVGTITTEEKPAS